MDEFAMYEGLRATRDADTCLAGLNRFRAALRGDGGPAFLARYLRQSPEWQELQNVWDAQLTIQHYHVTVTLLLALADALGIAAAAASGRQPASDEEDRRVLAAGAATLSSAILQRRLKALYFALSSDVRGKANAALALLAATAGACAGGAAGGSGAAGAGATAAAPSLRELVRAFDWSLSALPGLARPPREKKGESPADHRRRYWQQWCLGDPLKRPTRALFCQLAAALLRAASSGPAADALLLQQLVQLRPLLGGLLQHLAADPPNQQLQVLQLLQKRVLASKAGVPPGVQAEAFSDAALQQLATIATTAAVEGEEAEEEGEEEADGSSAERQAAAGAALEVLLAVATDPAHGLAAPSAVAGQFVLADAGSHQLLPGQRRLLRLLLRLRPADSAAHLQLLLAAAAADAPLAAALLLALPYSLEPAAAGAAAPASAVGRWFAHATVASRLLQLLPTAAQPGLQLAASGGGSAPTPGGRRAQALLRCCFPPCLHKAALSRGLQHANMLVRYGTLGLLLSAMSALDAVLQDCSAAAQSAATAGAAGAERRQGWLALRRWLQQAARQQLPDPTLLLALLAAAEKEGWKTANELQLTAVLRLLLLWQRLLPAALAEANVDAERLMPAQPLALHPQHQLLLLELLHAAADAAAAAAAQAADGSDSSSRGAGVPAASMAGAALLPPLRLLVGSPAAAVRAEARGWLLRRLLATGAFGGNEEEACLWLDLLPSGGEAVCGFLSEAVQLLLRRPHELLEQLQQLLAEAVAATSPDQQQQQQQQQQQFSLLALCALRQLLRVLPSAKIAAADKAATAAYVAAALRQLVQLQLSGPAAAVPLAAVLLGLVRQEAARQRQQQQAKQTGEAGAADGSAQEHRSSKKEKKRKHAEGGSDGSGAAEAAAGPLQLPSEGRPLLGLLAELEALLRLSQAAAGADEEVHLREKQKKKKKKSEEPAAGAAGEPAACSVAAVAEPEDGQAAEVPGNTTAAAAAAVAASDACCLLVSRLAATSSSSSKLPRLLAKVQQLLAADATSSSTGGGSSGIGAGTCSAAVRQCLYLLSQTGATDGATGVPLQVLQAAVLAAAGGGNRQALARCLHLLAGSSLVAAALASSDASELATAVTQLLRQLLASSSGSSSGPACSALLQQVSTAFVQLVAGSGQQTSSEEMPPAADRFMLLLPQLPAAVLGAAADAVLAHLPANSASSKGSKKKKRQAAEQQADAVQPWLAAAAAAVLQQLVACSSLHQQPQRLAQVCGLAVQLAGSSGGSGSAGVYSCLFQLLRSKQAGAAALAALGSSGRQQLLRGCLAAPAAGDLQPRSTAAAVLVERCSECRQLAAELLLGLLDGGGAAGLALALPAATVLLSQQQQQQLLQQVAGDEQQAGQDTAAALAAALQQPLLSYLTAAGGSPADGQPAKKQKKRSSNAAGSTAAEDASLAALVRQHALPCLRIALQRQPVAAQQRRQLLAALLPQQGWAVAAQGAQGGAPAQLGLAEQAEAAVLLLTSGSSPTIEELAGCVRCFAASLAAILKQPAGGLQAPLEQRLLSLLDGPVGDAVAALPASQRGTAAFAELATAAAGMLGTAVLRYRLAAGAAGDGAEASVGGSEAAAAAAGVAAMRVLRRFMAALLPEEEGDEEAGSDSSSSSGSDDEDSSSEDGSDRDAPAGRTAGRRLAAPQLNSPQVAGAALQLMQRLLGHSRFLPAMRAAGASPPPLPPAAQAQARPLVSLLPLAAAADGGAVGEPGSGQAGTQPAAAGAAAAAMKKELCELLETLLDLHQRFSGSSPPPAEQQQVAAAESALLPLLMAGYGASCSPTDCAVWSLAAAINRRQWERQGGADAAGKAAGMTAQQDADAAAVAALLHGPLSQSCFAWGPAAAAMQQLQTGAGDDEQQAQQRQLLQQRLLLDPLRAALTACHWPEACVLAAPGSSTAPEGSEWSGTSSGSSSGASGSDGGSSSGQLAQLPGCAAAYDPGFLLPFALCCLRQQLLAPRAFVEAGLLSVCLRALASADAGCRAAAYQALALFEAQLPAGGAGAALHGFKEAQQLSVLLGTLRAAVTRPFQRLPAVTAAFLAEAALLPPGAAMYPAVHKQLTRRAVLSAAEVPLLGQLLLAGGQQHAAERRWLLQLLLAGLRGPQDGNLYRRKHAFELAMALHDSCVAEPAAAALALRLLCTATYIPRAARQLTQESGLIPWLASAAEAALQQQAQPGGAAAQRQGGAGVSGSTEGLSIDPAAAAQEALAALRRLLQLRAVMRGSGSAAAAQEMAAAACRLAGTALAAAGIGGGKATSFKLGQQVLPFMLEVQRHVESSSSSNRGPGSKHTGLASSGLNAELAAAVDSLQALLGEQN